MSKCNRCKYEYSSKLDKPCKYCREKCGIVTLGYQMSEDKFEPKEEQSTIEHNGCMGCVYEDFEELEEPCVNCKGTYKYDTMAYLKANDYFEPKEEKVDEIDMVNHPPHYVGHGTYALGKGVQVYQMPQDEDVEV